MRLELALIIGILFFCSWCAYIVARMNASVSPAELQPPPPPPPPLQTQGANWTPDAPANRSQDLAQQTAAAATRQQQHQFDASEQLARYQMQPQSGQSGQFARPRPPYASLAAGQPPPPPPPPPPRLFQTERPASGHHVAQQLPPEVAEAQEGAQARARWRAGAPPTSLGAGAEFGPASELAGREMAPRNFEYGEAEEQEPEPEQELEPAQEEEDSAATSASDYPASQQSDEDEQDRDQENEQDQDQEQRPASELDELAQRRSFSELQSDSSERDKTGRLVATKRRHLINGRPVKAKRSSERPERFELARQTDDFERLVEEIDREDKPNKRAAAGVGVKLDGSAQESRRLERGASSAPHAKPSRGRRADGPATSAQHLATPSNSRAAAGARNRARKRPARDGRHEHRLQETLTQQQWDDDSSSSRAERPRGRAAGEEERVADIVERDAEARQLEGMARELLLDADAAELTRRRRAADEHDGDDGDGEEDDERQDKGPTGELKGREPEGLGDERAAPPPQSGGHNWERDDETEEREILEKREEESAQPAAGQGEAPLAGAGDESALLFVMGDERAHDKRPSDRSLSAGVAPAERRLIRSSIGASNEARPLGGAAPLPPLSPLPPEPPDELVSGQEDMHVEILAQPPGQNFSTLAAAPGPPPPLLPPPPPREANGPGLAHFPRVASPFASGSKKVAAKKKAREFAKKRSKLIGSKYKAARAYANKHKSKQKAGQMRKKRRKSQKKLVAGKKHFAGATRGLKKAHGRGASGARKGATYLKDKGYKKRGFKKAYHKLETGDHKTYFDEFRDKDHNRKWKNFDDKHKYSQKKKWAGHDLKHMKHHDLKEARGKASKAGKWREKAVSEQTKKAKQFHKKEAQKSHSVERGKRKKRRKRKRKEM